MANITLAGTLRDPNGDLAVGDKVRFTHKSTTGETVKSASSILTIDPTGVYSVDLEYGLVLVEYKDARSAQFENLGVATVNGTNPATTIPELLNALVPVSSAELIEFQAILADCVTAKVAAEAAAATLDLINDLSQAYIFDTVALFKASLIVFPDGKTIHLNDRGADFIKITGTGTGNNDNIISSAAVNQSISLIMKDGVYPAISFGALFDNSTPNQDLEVKGALDNTTGTVSLSEGTAIFNDEIVETSRKSIVGASMESIISQVTVDKKVFHFTDNGSSLTETPQVNNVRIQQVNSSSPGGGTANNHAPISFTGVHNGQAIGNWLDNTALGIKFEYGTIALTDRQTKFGLCALNMFDTPEKMAIENIGGAYTRVLGNAVDGKKDSATRGESHSLRLTGVSGGGISPANFEARCEGVVAAGNVFKSMLTGISAQNTASYWNVNSMYLEDIQVGVQVLAGASSDATINHGKADFTFKGVNQLVNNDGGQFLDINFNGASVDYDAAIALSGNGIIESNAPAFGGIGHNRYSGIMREVDENGIEVRYKNAVLDVSLINVNTAGTASSFAVRLNSGADNCTGKIVVDGCEDGVVIFSDNNILDVHVVGANVAKKAVTISGDNNSIRVFTDGDVIVSGIGNVLTGNITGNLSDTSADSASNNYSALTGYSKQRSEFSKVTSATGEVVITHGLKTSSLAVLATILGSNSNTVRVKTLNSTTITFEFRDQAGAVLNGATVSFYWRAEAFDA